MHTSLLHCFFLLLLFLAPCLLLPVSLFRVSFSITFNVHSFFVSYIRTSIITAAAFDLCSMLDLDASCLDCVISSYTYTYTTRCCIECDLCPVPIARSSFLNYVCESFAAASFVDLCNVSNAHSSFLLNYVCASSLRHMFRCAPAPALNRHEGIRFCVCMIR